MDGVLNWSIKNDKKLLMIYLDKDGQFTQRVIKVLSVTDQYVRAYCFNKKEYRVFKKENILSVDRIRQKAMFA